MAKKLHVLEVTKSTGGVAEYVRWLAQGLNKENFNLSVVCLSEGSREFAEELGHIHGVRTYALDMNRYKIDPLSDARVALQLRRIIRNGKFDLIHAHASKPGFLARLAAIGTGIPVIYSPHCFSFHAGAGRSRAQILAGFERMAARHWTSRIMTVSDGEQTLARQYAVGQDGQMITVHTGIDPSLFDFPVDREAVKESLGIPRNAFLVGSVGRMSDQKAPLDFIRMAAALHEYAPDVHFVWVGSGPLESAAQALSKEKGVEQVVHLLGQRGDVPNLLKTFDCFVLTSLWEGFPIVLLEAMAAGVPVVATCIPGNDEAVEHGVNGWLVPPGDPIAMANAVLDLIQNPENAERFIAAGRERTARKFNRRHMIQQISCLYDETAFLVKETA